MSWFASFFNSSISTDSDLPELYPLKIRANDFIKADILATYSKILTDVIERTDGIDEDIEPLMFDNCVQSESPEGLVTLLAGAMATQTDLYLVYAAGVLRRATQDEQTKIREDYKAKSESAAGVFISFKNYRRTQMLEIYSALEHCVLSSLNKTMNISKAIQFKISNMRSSVSLGDSAAAMSQAKTIAKGLAAGRDVSMDAEDSIEMATIDTSSTEKAIAFLDAKRAYYLGMPLSYINGEQTGGIGTTGEADARAVERGLNNYFIAIVQPVLLSLFGLDNTEFRTEDYRQISSALEAAKIFDLVSDDFLSRESKQIILARLFGVDPIRDKKLIEKDAKLPPREHAAIQVTAGALGNGV